VKISFALKSLIIGCLLVLAAVAVAVPVNDSFTNRITLTGVTNSITGNNVGATEEAGEPIHGCVPSPPFYSCPAATNTSVWYDYTPPQDGMLELNNNGSSITVIMAVYTGGGVAALTGTARNFVYDFDSGTRLYPKRIRFNVVGGVTYLIAIDSVGAHGNFKLSHSFTPAPVNDFFSFRSTIVSPVTSLFGSVYGATIETNESAQAKGGLHPVSIWWSWTAPSDDPFVLSTSGDRTDTVLAIYTGNSLTNLTPIAQNDDAFDFPGGSGSQLSPDDKTSRLLFQPLQGETYHIQLYSKEEDSYPPARPGNVALNFRTVAIEDIVSLSRTLQGNFTMTFSAVLKLTNFRPQATSSLRVRMIAVASYRMSNALKYNLDFIESLKAPDQALAVFNLPAPGYITGSNSTQITVSGTCPAQTGSSTIKTNWNAVGILEELVGGTWIARDVRLIAPQLYPGDDGLTGGGVSILGSGLSLGLFDFGSFRVLTEPAAELSNNGGWKVIQTADATYYNDNLATYGLPAGTNYTLSFRPVAGFITPSNRNLTVVANQTNTISVTYTNLSPKNPVSSLSNGSFYLKFIAPAGQRYALERSTNLVNWASLTTNLVPTNGLLSFTNSGTASIPRAFYRARWVP
jgi:hypothetical protein